MACPRSLLVRCGSRFFYVAAAKDAGLCNMEMPTHTVNYERRDYAVPVLRNTKKIPKDVKVAYYAKHEWPPHKKAKLE